VVDTGAPLFHLSTRWEVTIIDLVHQLTRISIDKGERIMVQFYRNLFVDILADIEQLANRINNLKMIREQEKHIRAFFPWNVCFLLMNNLRPSQPPWKHNFKCHKDTWSSIILHSFRGIYRYDEVKVTQFSN